MIHDQDRWIDKRFDALFEFAKMLYDLHSCQEIRTSEGCPICMAYNKAILGDKH